ncbi:MAG: hypothetical protein A3K68_04105 [Euryarchaeota archaeon RBG_16_68_13]|nr:MAG: hypothetical protein A3K68_04105 [Euryarchaeota archaeon RBG_16_68_13]
MEDLAAFASSHPQLSDPAKIRVPGLGSLPVLDGARTFELTPEGLQSFRASAPKDPETLPRMLKQGPEAVAFYVSFRFGADRWGIYIREAGLKALQEEYHRIIWRDLGKYVDRDVSEIAERIEYTLVLDYLLAHNRVHFLVDRVAADWESQGGTARYAPYQEAWYATTSKPPAQPEDIGNLEEALANLEAFRSYMNPTYGDSVAALVDGRLEERNVQEWKAFFVGGRFAVEMANMLSRQPAGWKDFARFLNRKTSVGSTNYVRIMYSYNPEALERGQVELARRLAGNGPAPGNPFKDDTAPMPPIRVL